MIRSSIPGFAGMAALCAALFFSPNVRSAATDPEMQRLRDPHGTIFAFAPHAKTVTSAPMTIVYLHGIHGHAENGCPWLHEGAGDLGWLMCPNANTKNEDGTFSWGGTLGEQRAVVARAERAAHAQGATGPTVLVGFSQGAYLTMHLVKARLGTYKGLVLIGADVTPDRVELEAAGVSRVVLAAGQLDGTYGPLKRAAARLEKQGMSVRFVDLGKIGHSYATPNTDALRDAIVWVGSS